MKRQLRIKERVRPSAQGTTSLVLKADTIQGFLDNLPGARVLDDDTKIYKINFYEEAIKLFDGSLLYAHDSFLKMNKKIIEFENVQYTAGILQIRAAKVTSTSKNRELFAIWFRK